MTAVTTDAMRGHAATRRRTFVIHTGVFVAAGDDFGLRRGQVLESCVNEVVRGEQFGEPYVGAVMPGLAFEQFVVEARQGAVR